MSAWTPEAVTLTNRPPSLVFFDNDEPRKERRILRLQGDVPELREKIKDSRRSVARARKGATRKAAVAQLAKRRHELHRIGELLRALSAGQTSGTWHRDSAWWVWSELTDHGGGELRFAGVHL